MKEELKFETFTDFCNRADEILDEFKQALSLNQITIKSYQNYIYNEHNFSDNKERDILVKDKCWQWMMSYEYEPMCKNDLYSVLGQLRKGS